MISELSIPLVSVLAMLNVWLTHYHYKAYKVTPMLTHAILGVMCALSTVANVVTIGVLIYVRG